MFVIVECGMNHTKNKQNKTKQKKLGWGLGREEARAEFRRHVNYPHVQFRCSGQDTMAEMSRWDRTV